MLETQGLQSTAARVKTPIIIPMSDFEPPWAVMNMGKRKKEPKLDTVKRLDKDIAINEGL
jgi:hypothetical protein